MLPPNGADYAQILRGAGHAWWRSLLGVALALGGLLFVTALINQGLVALAWAMTGRSQDIASYARQAYAFELPSGVLAAGLAVAALAPISWLLVAVLHRMLPRWPSSVRPRLRWGYLLVALGIALVVFLGAQWLFALIEPRGAWALRPGVSAFLVIILLVTPLQAAAEEVFFRGYLLQAFGSLASGPWLGIGLSALVFAVLHGGQSPAMFSDRLVLGLLAGVLVGGPAGWRRPSPRMWSATCTPT